MFNQIRQMTKLFSLIIILLLIFACQSWASDVLISKNNLKKVLSDANSFVKVTSPITHYIGYMDQNHKQIIGVAFLTTDIVNDMSWGYRDQIATLVGLDSNGKIVGITVLQEDESPRYTKGLLNDESWFIKQYYGKDASDAFVINYDVDAISGATITSSAINRSIKAGLLLVSQKVLAQQIDQNSYSTSFSLNQILYQIVFLFLWIIAGISVFAFLKKNEILHFFILGMTFSYLGIFMGGGFSMIDVFRVLSFNPPDFWNNLYWYSLLFLIIGFSIFAGRFYCGWLCPFGAFLEILFRLVPFNYKVPDFMDQFLKIFKYVILLVLLFIYFILKNKTLSIYLIGIVEPFATFFHLDGNLIAFLFLIVILIVSSFISRFFCRYICPLGAFLAVITAISSTLGLQLLKVQLPSGNSCQDNCIGCRLAQKKCKAGAITYHEKLKYPEIDRNECFMCNTCAGNCPIVAKKSHK